MFEVDVETLATSHPGVFACGDAAGDRANVTDAAATGRRAAMAIHIFLTRDSARHAGLMASTAGER
ncbi:MAG TPA: hypothetical protein VGW38_14690 [Chloroflexota bacterium]|nr:hypothetical protein [Chloroflexota bacterium]